MTRPEQRVPMSEEDWEINKDCELKKRDHKWHWKHDIATGLPSMTQAICAHCGKETTLTRSDYHER
jgi:hypothetical protein